MLAAISPGDAPFAQVVGGKLHLHPISWHHTHEIQANFARKVRQYHAPTIQRHTKHRIGQSLGYDTLDHNGITLGHNILSLLQSPVLTHIAGFPSSRKPSGDVPRKAVFLAREHACRGQDYAGKQKAAANFQV
jgi:hypothetical protein